MVAKFVSCEFWNDKRAIVHNAIAMFLQKAWHICNAYKHDHLTDIDVADGVVSASMRRGADGIIDARAFRIMASLLLLLCMHVMAAH